MGKSFLEQVQAGKDRKVLGAEEAEFVSQLPAAFFSHTYKIPRTENSLHKERKGKIFSFLTKLLNPSFLSASDFNQIESLYKKTETGYLKQSLFRLEEAWYVKSEKIHTKRYGEGRENRVFVLQELSTEKKALLKSERNGLKKTGIAHEEEILKHIGREVLGSFTIENKKYLALPYITGSDLVNYLNDPKQTIPLVERLEIVQKIIQEFETLVYKHQIWHLDIKPENIIITPKREIFFIDFATSVYNPENKEVMYDGACKGTPRRMAPEVYRSALTNEQQQYSYTLAGEIFSLGTVLRDVLYDADNIILRTPLERKSQKEEEYYRYLDGRIEKIAQVYYLKMRHYKPHWNALEQVCEFCNNMLSPDAKNRPGSLDLLKEHLTEAIAQIRQTFPAMKRQKSFEVDPAATNSGLLWQFGSPLDQGEASSSLNVNSLQGRRAPSPPN